MQVILYDFNVDIANDNNFKSFKYKAKLLENTELKDQMEFYEMHQLLCH